MYTIHEYFLVNIANDIDPELVRLEDFMIFFSGSETPRPLGFLRKPYLEFSYTNIYPTASTFALIFTLPTKYGRNYEAFKEAMMTGLKCHWGFGNP